MVRPQQLKAGLSIITLRILPNTADISRAMVPEWTE